MSLRIVFMGTPEFSVPSLERLVEEGYRPVAVATVPDVPGRRGAKLQASAVKRAALCLGIDNVMQPESVKDPAFAADVADLGADVIVVVAFKILPPAVPIWSPSRHSPVAIARPKLAMLSPLKSRLPTTVQLKRLTLA